MEQSKPKPAKEKAGINPAGYQMTCCMIALDDIVERSPIRYRVSQFDPENQEVDAALVNSIKKFGVLEPILVQLLPNRLTGRETYSYIFGERRVFAARLAGLKYIPAMVAPENLNVLILGIVENQGHLTLSSFERAKEFEAYRREHPNASDREIARVFGFSHSYISELRRTLENSTETLQLLIHGDRIKYKTVEILKPIFASLREAEQYLLAAVLARGISRSQATELVDRIKLDRVSAVEAAKRVLYNDLMEQPPSSRSGQEHEATDSVENNVEAPTDAMDENVSAEPTQAILTYSEKLEFLKQDIGLAESKAEALLRAAAKINATFEVTAAAGLAVLNGGDPQTALGESQEIMTARKYLPIAGLIRRRLQSLPTYRLTVIKTHPDFQEFLMKYFGLDQDWFEAHNG